MSTLSAIVLALALCACSDCGTAQQRPIDWPAVVQCGHVMRDDVVLAVQEVLAELDPEQGDTSRVSERAVAQLEQLAERHGPGLVVCVVAEVVRSYERAALRLPVGVAVSDEALAAQRGRDFLQRVGSRAEVVQ